MFKNFNYDLGNDEMVLVSVKLKPSIICKEYERKPIDTMITEKYNGVLYNSQHDSLGALDISELTNVSISASEIMGNFLESNALKNIIDSMMEELIMNPKKDRKPTIN